MNKQQTIIKKAKAFIKDKTQEASSQEAISTLLEEIKKRREAGFDPSEMEKIIDALQIALGT